MPLNNQKGAGYRLPARWASYPLLRFLDRATLWFEKVGMDLVGLKDAVDATDAR